MKDKPIFTVLFFQMQILSLGTILLLLVSTYRLEELYRLDKLIPLVLIFMMIMTLFTNILFTITFMKQSKKVAGV